MRAGATGWADGRPLGFGTFKGAPDGHGEVELGYLTFPASEGQGVATAIAAELVRLAWANGAPRVLAQTLPENGASTRVLEKNGFRRDGIGHDPEVGPVWRWLIAQPKDNGDGDERC